MDTQSVGVEVKLSFFPLAFLLLLCFPRVEIDGVANTRYWGTHLFLAKPGRHNVRIYFRYLFAECGANSIVVNVPEGGMVRLSYYMWPWVFAKGSLSVRK